MPSRSTAQRRAMAIAEHYPEELYGRNRSLLDMTQSQLHDFASTKEKGLPHYKTTKPQKPKRPTRPANPMSVRKRAMPSRIAKPRPTY